MNYRLTTAPASLSGQLGPQKHTGAHRQLANLWTATRFKGGVRAPGAALEPWPWPQPPPGSDRVLSSTPPRQALSRSFSFPWSLLTRPKMVTSPWKLNPWRTTHKTAIKHLNQSIQLFLIQDPPQLSPPLSSFIEFFKAAKHHLFWV